jgi:TolA-binding protein
VSGFINKTFVPLEIHIKENPTGFHRFDVLWTPTVLIMDSEGKERMRNEGYLPKPEFQAWLDMSLARLAFVAKKWTEAEKKFAAVIRQYPDSGVAAYSVYWRGVSRYKETKDHKDLSAITEEFRRRYRDSIWAKKAVVWGD